VPAGDQGLRFTLIDATDGSCEWVERRVAQKRAGKSIRRLPTLKHVEQAHA
jgi:hypothetical protein